MTTDSTITIPRPSSPSLTPDPAVRALFSSYQLGPITLANRIVMAPMTRNRAAEGNVPTALNATYYAQRAGAGLIVTEGTQPSATGQGYPATPGLHTDAQVAGWRLVTDAVHAAGGHIFAQLMHAGRISHPSVLPGGATPVAPSAVRPAGQVFTGSGMAPFETPRALDTHELAAVVAEFVDAARRADAAGFDGVELHGANGYLLNQFLAANANTRTDAYGGSPEGRIRLVVEVAEAVAEAIGAERVGIRVSPGGTFNDIDDAEAHLTYPALARALDGLRLAYLHVIEPGTFSAVDLLRPVWSGTLIAAGGFDAQGAAALVEAGRAELVAFGHHFIANPDLPARIACGAALAEGNSSTYYGGDHRGYIDYPALGEK